MAAIPVIIGYESIEAGLAAGAARAGAWLLAGGRATEAGGTVMNTAAETTVAESELGAVTEVGAETRGGGALRPMLSRPVSSQGVRYDQLQNTPGLTNLRGETWAFNRTMTGGSRYPVRTMPDTQESLAAYQSAVRNSTSYVPYNAAAVAAAVGGGGEVAGAMTDEALIDQLIVEAVGGGGEVGGGITEEELIDQLIADTVFQLLPKFVCRTRLITVVKCSETALFYEA